MDELLKKLLDLLNRLEETKGWDLDVLIDTRNKLNLYLKKYLNNDDYYQELLKEIKFEPQSEEDFYDAVVKLKSLVSTLIEDIQLSYSDVKLTSEKESQDLLHKIREEAEIQREKIENESKKIQSIGESIRLEREQLLSEQDKFNEFKTKLELADKNLDFQAQSLDNKRAARLWGIATIILITILLIVLFISLDTHNSFSEIAIKVKSDLKQTDKVDQLTFSTIYFTYSKYIFTKLFLYSMFIYAVIFCVKNYNAQMHNQIINSHKSNALKSTLSLLDTAKSDDGNDKLLIQATQAIFGHQQTGYSGKDTEPANPNLITNVIDAASKKI